jgi:hypothetical protein
MNTRLPHHGRLILAALAALAPFGTAQGPTLGNAGTFAVLAGSSVINVGPSVVLGDLGVMPGLAITGFPPGLVSGTIHAGDALALRAQNDLIVTDNALGAAVCTRDLSGTNLGGLTLTPGVYCFTSTAQLTGTLTLDAGGNSSAVFIFKTGSSLTTASASVVRLINGADACNVFWKVGSSATIGSTTSFLGNVIALASITMNSGAQLTGRAFARTGSVTLGANTVQIPTTCCLGLASWNNYGVGWPGTGGIPSIGLSARPILGTTPNVVVQNVYTVPTFALILFGDVPANIPTAFGGTILVQPLLSSSTSIGNGLVSLPLRIPLDPRLTCVAFDLQILEYDKGASNLVAFTPGLHIVLGL